MRTNLHKIYKDVVKILHLKLFVHKGPGALLAKIEYDGILGNPQGLMCKKRQITYRYFMFCRLKVKKSPGGLTKPHYHHGGKI